MKKKWKTKKIIITLSKDQTKKSNKNYDIKKFIWFENNNNKTKKERTNKINHKTKI